MRNPGFPWGFWLKLPDVFFCFCSVENGDIERQQQQQQQQQQWIFVEPEIVISVITEIVFSLFFSSWRHG